MRHNKLWGVSTLSTVEAAMHFCFEMQPKALSAYDLAHDKLCILLVSAMCTGLFILYGIFKRDAWKSGDQQ